ncbi:transposase, IS605 OrfB family [Allomeiothermus silvanus DSM 9946]|uniref:Transposase, IS605 OrfB family n=1 Tax=Allomeiothermus silvanus (strain ATCC 700542 / DSM 9946 / NBRC 106475 / NCIMB 13440 / VI-R2) TaxID=526227 RepID=D7BAS5_ALLS1|nr:RNA-guided endonuclease TnpB family protein [Allomeiothermus silvanus]ADH62597.1 transposase, IS605 OrfB family [Allomeiothermus silvanus DSM 9946]
MMCYTVFVQTLTLRCTLKPTPEQAAALAASPIGEHLAATVRLFAQGCNHALRVAKERGEFRRFQLHHLVYRDLRAMGLSANLAVQAIARVGRKKGSRAKFYQPTSCTFDPRTLSLRGESVSLTTTAGRLVIPMKLGNYQRGLLKRAKSVQGGVLTQGPKGKWYLNLILRLETPTPPTGGGRVVGVDLGQKVLATLSSGVQFSGGSLKGNRLHYLAKRAEVQSKLDRPSERTRGTRRLWERLTGREARFVNHTLHTPARRIVDGLEPGDTLAIEDLTHLRSRTAKRGKKERHLHNLWPYARLRSLLEYKAALRGVQVVAVDPRHTSQECPRCGHTAKENRKSQALFRCAACGFQHNADWVAAHNIALRAGPQALPQGIVARRAGSTGMGREGSGIAAGRCAPNLCKPARILRVSSLHRFSSESLYQTA